MKKYRNLFLLFFCLTVVAAGAQPGQGYQTPPAAIADLVNAPQTPAVSVDSRGEWMLLLARPGYPSVAELARPELRIAGLRINPRTNGSSRSSSFNGLTLKNMKTGKDIPVQGLPAEPEIENVRWSPDGSRIAFTLIRDNGIELWVADVATQQARQLTGARVNDIMGAPYDWFPDSRTLLVRLIPDGRGEAPVKGETLTGPVTQQTSGDKAAVRTYQDLLGNPYDEALFEYYGTAQLAVVDAAGGPLRPFGPAGIIRSADISPDGNYVLVSAIHRPFSYLVPFSRFPTAYDVYDRTGQLVAQVADVPLAENIPKGFDAVAEGPRSFQWRADAPATLCWVEAQDGGDPARDAEVRDRLFSLAAPFTGQPQAGIGLERRYAGILWGSDALAVVYERWWSKRQLTVSRFTPGKPDGKTVLFDYSYEDRYNDPGSFATTDNAAGRPVLLTGSEGNTLYLTGAGASPEGNRPFLREFDLNTNKTRELWRSEAPYYESPQQILDARQGLVVTRRESRDEPPNYYLRNWKKNQVRPLTAFPHPYPALKGIEKQVVSYARKDGLSMQGDLYLPQGYDPKKDGPLPVIMWAYPREFKSADAAGQVAGSPYEFIRLNWGSPLYWVTQGYAVFDNLSMPIIGEGDQEPNDSFREQLVANAEAAVNKIADMGVGDRNRIAVGGHSYGAFMTANLLAHSDLFAAGIARSGAYNRTLTPFGFQSEERTYWDAPELYNGMSPFMHADKIDEPILLIHGEADNNSGTFPIQSERLYAAIKGLGGTARLVMLPHESHGYRGRESILHMLWEQNQWLDKYVKNRGKAAQP